MMESSYKNVKFPKSTILDSNEEINSTKKNYEKKNSRFKRILIKDIIHKIYMLKYYSNHCNKIKSWTILEKEKWCSKSVLRLLFSELGIWNTNLEEEKKSLTTMGVNFLLLDFCTQSWSFFLEIFRLQLNVKYKQATIIYRLKTKLHEAKSYYEIAILKRAFLELTGAVSEISFYCPIRYAASLETFEESYKLKTEGFVIVETNFRVYGYTSSLTKIAQLRFFTKPKCLLSNLYVGIITHSSCQKAFGSGMTAVNILSFLRQSAHPQVLQKFNGALPEVVEDQICIWESGKTNLIF